MLKLKLIDGNTLYVDPEAISAVIDEDVPTRLVLVIGTLQYVLAIKEGEKEITLQSLLPNYISNSPNFKEVKKVK